MNKILSNRFFTSPSCCFQNVAFSGVHVNEDTLYLTSAFLLLLPIRLVISSTSPVFSSLLSMHHPYLRTALQLYTKHQCVCMNLQETSGYLQILCFHLLKNSYIESRNFLSASAANLQDSVCSSLEERPTTHQCVSGSGFHGSLAVKAFQKQEQVFFLFLLQEICTILSCIPG